ncbi:MAG: hypothetical protein WBD53_20785 [Xanthobacteraceae bacterium]
MSRLVGRDTRLGEGRLFSLQASPVRAQIAAVAPTVAGQGHVAGADQQTDTDDYATRMVKYIPAEVVAFYLAADKLFVKGAQAINPNIAEAFVTNHLFYFSVGVFVIALVGTPIYLRQQAAAGQPWQVQSVVSTLAFVIWAYAVQGQVFTAIYSSAISAFLVLVFTFASGFVKPGK